MEFDTVCDFPEYLISPGGWVIGKRGKLLKHRMSRKGYLVVHLYGPHGRKCRTIHSLVARTYLGYPPDGQQVRHKDGIPVNVWVGNLEYGTLSQNNTDKHRHGTYFNPNLGRKTCVNGHTFADAYVYVRPDGTTHRHCRTCVLERAASREKTRPKRDYRAERERRSAKANVKGE